MLANKEIQEVLDKHVDLVYDQENDSLTGELWITNDDSYFVEIELEGYPKFLPKVYEVGERIPRKLDRHIYSDTGSCCFTTAAIGQILLKTEIGSLLEFIDKIVVPYFWNNSFFELNDCYYDEEYSHSLGVIEGYRDILKIDNDLLIARTISRWLENGKQKVHEPCYCGSGAPMKKCTNGLHDRGYRLLRKVDKDVAKHDLFKHFAPYLKATGQIKF